MHNTYGDRHAYLVHPDEQGRARTDKAMYVSPFHGVDGWYDIAVPVPTDRLDIAVTLRGHDAAARRLRPLQRQPDRHPQRRAGCGDLGRRPARQPRSSAPTASGCGPGACPSAPVPTHRQEGVQ